MDSPKIPYVIMDQEHQPELESYLNTLEKLGCHFEIFPPIVKL